MKRIVFFAAIIFLAVVVVNLSFSLVTLWSKKDLLTTAKLQLEKEKKEHETLQNQLKQVNDPSFVERQARDKLFLGKPGDSLVIFPTASPSGMPSRSGDSRPIWQQWWEFFFQAS